MTRRFLSAAVVGAVLAAAAVGAADDKPTPADVLLREGKRLREAKDFDGAREFFEAANTLAPKNPAVLVQLAWVYNEQKTHDLAAKTAQDALKEAPANSDALCELGYAHFKLKQYLKAITSLRKAVEKDDKNWTAYGYLALALRAVGEDEEAAEVEATRKKKMAPPPAPE